MKDAIEMECKDQEFTICYHYMKKTNEMTCGGFGVLGITASSKDEAITIFNNDYPEWEIRDIGLADEAKL